MPAHAASAHVASAIRSPFARTDGAIAEWHPVDLIAELMTNPQLDLDQVGGLDIGGVEEVFVGCAEPVGAQGANLARAAVLTAGWPDRLSGVVIDRAETSGTAALHAAAAAIASGQISTALVVGVCSASNVPPGASALARTYGRPWGDGPGARVEAEGGLLPAPVAAERAAAAAGVSRLAQDEWAVASLERRRTSAASAVVPVAARPGGGVAVQRGTPVRADVWREAPADPAALSPSFDPEGTVTGFTFAPPADGVTVMVLTSRPIGAEIVGVGRSAGHPLDPTGGIATAVEHALGAHRREAVGRWELTEPTAAAALVALGHLDIDASIANPDGGTLAVGDTGAAEELRLIADGLAPLDGGDMLAALAHGPGGAAATLLRPL